LCQAVIGANSVRFAFSTVAVLTMALLVRVKHTFIEVTVCPKHNPRCQSCPPNFRQDRCGTNEHCFGDHTEWAYKWQEETSFSDNMSLSPRDCGNTSCTDEGMCTQKKQGKQRARPRPCKGKRLRFRRLIAGLKSKIEAQVENFNIQEVSWPPSLIVDDTKRQKLIQKMECYQQHVWYAKYSGMQA